MIGVAVVAILSVGVSATVFGAIPWAQNHSAKQNVTAIRTAEGMAANSHGSFLDTAALKKAGYLEGTAGLGIVTNGRTGDKGCFVTVTQSKSGKMYYGSDSMTEPAELKEGTKDPCVLGAKLQDAINEAGGKIVAGTDAYSVTRAGGSDQRASSVPTSTSADHAAVAGLEGKTITEIASGTQHTCAIADNQPWCWGYKPAYRLGNKENSATYAATAVKASVSKLPAGEKLHGLTTYFATTCVIAADKPYCWGNNQYGNIDPANVATTSVGEPTLVPGMATRQVADLSAGYTNTCAVSEGAAWCWGKNSWGLNGNGVDDPSGISTYQAPTKVGGALAGKTVTAVSVGRTNACAVADGSLYCWGSAGKKQLPMTGTLSTTPLKIPGLPKDGIIGDISIGNNSICAVVDTALWCWGNNANGEIGNGTTTTVSKPHRVKGALQGKDVETVGSGYSGFTCALASGDAYCWGSGLYGQTGLGIFSDQTMPAKVATPAGQRPVIVEAGDINSFIATVPR